MTYFFDTYALIEIINGNKNYNWYKEEIIYTSILNVAELWQALLKNFDEEIVRRLYSKLKLQLIEIEEQLILGLEQARDTVMPTVELRKRFKPFVEDELSGLIKGKLAIVAHPGVKNTLKAKPKKSIVLVVGPEGGFVSYELEKFDKLGFKPFNLGERILRVEAVVPYILGKLAIYTPLQ